MRPKSIQNPQPSPERNNCSSRMQTPETSGIEIFPGIRSVDRDAAVVCPRRTKTDLPAKVTQIPRILTSLLRVPQLDQNDLQLLRNSRLQRKSLLPIPGQGPRLLQQSEAASVQFSKTCTRNDGSVRPHASQPIKIGAIFEPLLRPV